MLNGEAVKSALGGKLLLDRDFFFKLDTGQLWPSTHHCVTSSDLMLAYYK